MTRFLTLIRRHLAKPKVNSIASGVRSAPAEKKAAQRRVQKAMKATRRMHRV